MVSYQCVYEYILDSPKIKGVYVFGPALKDQQEQKHTENG